MWRKTQQLLDRLESRYALYTALAGSSAMGMIGAWVASYSDWVRQFGAIGWFLTGLLVALAVALALSAIAYTRLAWMRAGAVRRWSEQVDDFNPMEPEFTRKRIKIADIADPADGCIKSKRFIDCDLVGPANIVLMGGSFSNVGFINCDIVPCREGAFINNAIGIKESEMIGGRIVAATIFAPPKGIEQFIAMGAPLVAYTKDEALGLQSRPNSATGTPP